MGPTSESRSLAVHSLSRRQLVGGFPLPLPCSSASLRLRVAPPRCTSALICSVQFRCTAILGSPNTTGVLSPYHYFVLYCTIITIFVLYLYCIHCRSPLSSPLLCTRFDGYYGSQDALNYICTVLVPVFVLQFNTCTVFVLCLYYSSPLFLFSADWLAG